MQQLMEEIEPIGDRRGDLRMAIGVTSIKASLSATPMSSRDMGVMIDKLANYIESSEADAGEVLSPERAMQMLRGS